MPKVAIVTDSTADFPVEYIEKYNITVVPLSVIFEETAYVDNGVDITIDEFYEKLKTSKKLPTTTQPTPADFLSVYEKLLKDHESIISVHISKKMSGTHDSAEAARKELGAASDITVIDSEVTTIALGLIILKAARLASEDKPKEDILKAIDDLKSKIDTLFIPRTLEYLQKGGRIGRAKGLIASLLEIKPVLTLHLGEVSQYKTTRRWSQAKNELTNSMQSMIKGKGGLTVAVADADLKAEGDEISAKIIEFFKPDSIIRTTIGCIVGTHLGPGLAIAFYEE
jgi:DegV family protein with EDD domain